MPEESYTMQLSYSQEILRLLALGPVSIVVRRVPYPWRSSRERMGSTPRRSSGGRICGKNFLQKPKDRQKSATANLRVPTGAVGIRHNNDTAGYRW
jgi:hypothetical protein